MEALGWDTGAYEYPADKQASGSSCGLSLRSDGGSVRIVAFGSQKSAEDEPDFQFVL